MTDSTGAVHAPHPDITSIAHAIYAELTDPHQFERPPGATIGVYVTDAETLHVLVGALTAEFVLGHQGPIGLRVATVDLPQYSLQARSFWVRVVHQASALVPLNDAGRPMAGIRAQLVIEQYWDGPSYIRDGVHDNRADRP